MDGATANQQFPGVLILPDQDGTWTFPATLVVWHPSGSPANPTGLPLYSELVIYTHDPNSPNGLVELTTPGDRHIPTTPTPPRGPRVWRPSKWPRRRKR